MKEILKGMEGKCVKITGTFVRYGTKDGLYCKWNTAILKDILLDGTKISDHMWFTLKQDWLRTQLVEGTKLSVIGRVEKDMKNDGTYDYGLVDTNNLRIIERGNGIIKPSKEWKVGSYNYYKFLTNNGPRWYREKDSTIERIIFVFDGNGGFNEKLINKDSEDGLYINIINQK